MLDVGVGRGRARVLTLVGLLEDHLGLRPGVVAARHRLLGKQLISSSVDALSRPSGTGTSVVRTHAWGVPVLVSGYTPRMGDALVVRDNPQQGRYEILDGGQVVGIADYRVVGDRVLFPHTEVEPSRRGQGVGAVLVRGALDDVRRQGRSVVAQCWYVAQFIDENPGYADLVAA